MSKALPFARDKVHPSVVIALLDVLKQTRQVTPDFIREISFNDAKYVVSATDAADIGYTITNICIEYETVHSEELARQIDADYMNGHTFTTKLFISNRWAPGV